MRLRLAAAWAEHQCASAPAQQVAHDRASSTKAIESNKGAGLVPRLKPGHGPSH